MADNHTKMQTTLSIMQGQNANFELEPCPFCGNKIRIIVCDDEGNEHDADYEHDPWSGLGYMLYHDITDDPKEKCPIAKHKHEGIMGIFIYDTREEAIDAWNRRADNGEAEESRCSSVVLR